MTATPFTPPQAHVSLGPATKGFAITPSDSTKFDPPTRYIYVGGTGHLDVVLAGDDTVLTLSAIPVGTLLPLCAVQVKAATTASLLIGLR